MQVNDVPLASDGRLSARAVREIERTGQVWLTGEAGSPASLAPLRGVAEFVRDLSVPYGSADLEDLPVFEELESLNVLARPRRFKLGEHPRLRTLNLRHTPTIRRALVDADLPSLATLQLHGGVDDLWRTDLPLRPTTLSFMHARDLRGLDPRLGWLSEVQKLEVYRTAQLDLAVIASLPSLRTLELHSVRELSGVGAVGEALAETEVVFENCHQATDVDAFLALRARSIRLVGDHYPISRRDADRLPVEEREPEGPWRLPLDLGGPEPFFSGAEDDDEDLFGIPLYVEEVPPYLFAQDYSHGAIARVIEVLRARLDPHLDEPPPDAEYEAQVLPLVSDYVLAAGEPDVARWWLAHVLLPDWAVELDEGERDVLAAAIVAALDAPVNDR